MADLINMKLTRSQKASFAVLAVAVGAFVVDRMFSPRRRRGRGGGRTVGHRGGRRRWHQQSRERRGRRRQRDERWLISAKLKSLPGVNVEQVRDAFAPSGKWADAHRPAAVAPQERSSGAVEFASRPQAHGGHGRRGGVGGDALVDGKVVHVGQKVGEWRLVSLTSRSAVFTSGDAKATLLLP